MLGIGLSLWAPTGAASPSWTPANLFASGEVGDWWTATSLSKLFVDKAGATPVAADGDAVGRWVGSVNSTVLWQPTDTTSAKPIYRSSLKTIVTDGVDDFLESAATLAITASPVTICGVFDQSVAAAANGAFGLSSSGSEYRNIGLWNPGTSAAIADRGATSTSSAPSLLRPGSSGLQSVWGLFNTAAGGGDTFFFVEATTATIASPPAHTIAGNVQYGRLRTTGNYTALGMREMLIVNRILTLAERNLLRTYWGVT